MRKFKESGIVRAVSMLLTVAVLLGSGIIALAGAESSVCINEICSGNNGGNDNLTDQLNSQGEYCDWIELYNSGSNAVDLGGWGVSDKADNPFKCTLKSGTTIAAGGYLVIYCSKTYAGAADKANVAINISGDGETLLITSPDSLTTDSVDLPALAKDYTYSRIPDGTDTFSVTTPTPGASNANADDIGVPAPVFSHESGMYDAAFTLTMSNPGEGDIYYTLNGTDPADSTNTKRLKYTNGVKIYDRTGEKPAHMSSAKPEVGNSNIVRACVIKNGTASKVTARSYFIGATTFTYNMPILSISTDYNNLWDYNTGIYVDGVTKDNYIRDNSLFGIGSKIKVEMPQIAAGEYSMALQTRESSEGSDFQVYVNDVAVGDPIASIKNGNTDHTVGTFTQAADGAAKFVLQLTSKGKVSVRLVSITLTNTLSQQVTTLAFSDMWEYASVMYSEADGWVAPAQKDSYGGAIKIIRFEEIDGTAYTTPKNYTQSGREWERECRIEYFDNDGTTLLEQECGMRIMGSYSRISGQKSFRFFARKDYGDNWFDCDFFDGALCDVNGKVVDKHKTFVLRNGGNDAGDIKFTDSYLQELLRSEQYTCQYAKPVIAYLNGEFWGLYCIRDDYSSDYIASRYDVDEEEIIYCKNGEIKDGIEPVYDADNNLIEANDLAEYTKLVEFIKNNDMTVAENYNRVQEMVDISSLIGYYAAEMADGNADWPKNNYALWKTRTVDATKKYADGKWRFMLFDLDHSASSWGDEKYNSGRFLKICQGTISFANNDLTDIISGLFRNLEFRQSFLTCLNDKANVNFDPYVCSQLLDKTEYFYRNDPGPINFHIKKFGLNYDKRIVYLRDFIAGRKGYVSSAIKSVAITATKKTASALYTLTLDTNELNGGTVKCNTADVDLNRFENNIYKGNYLSNYPLTLTAQPKEGYRFTGWSGASDSTDATVSFDLTANISITANFEPIPTPIVCINEVCTSNGGANSNAIGGVDNLGDYCDWIELYNSGATAVDISGWGVSDDTADLYKATVPVGTIIAAHSYLIIYCNKEFAASPGLVSVAVNLSDKGETVCLTSTDGVNKDVVIVPEIAKDTTYARIPDGSYSFCNVLPTPGATNESSVSVTTTSPTTTGGQPATTGAAVTTIPTTIPTTVKPPVTIITTTIPTIITTIPTPVPTTIPTTKIPTTIPTTTISLVLYGDVNSDKGINAKDVLLLKQWLANWTVTIDNTAADVNVDNKVNAKDLLRLRQYLANWPVKLGQ